MAADSVVIPPGHKVVVVKPTSSPSLATTPGGTLILDYGRNNDWRSTNAELEAELSRRSAPVIVILQSEVIDSLAKANELTLLFAQWKSFREKGTQAVWVLPLQASARVEVVKSIREVGFGVHASPPDGACFVEVHKPDGSVTVGMPGPAIQ